MLHTLDAHIVMPETLFSDPVGEVMERLQKRVAELQILLPLQMSNFIGDMVWRVKMDIPGDFPWRKIGTLENRDFLRMVIGILGTREEGENITQESLFTKEEWARYYSWISREEATKNIH